MSVRLLILEHVKFEGAGSIEHWAYQNNFSITKTRFFDANWALPTIEDFDLLVIMGGPMAVDDQIDFPWLAQEKALIAQAIAANKKILGVCLGAQLIAAVLGARVRSNKNKEIGWFDVEQIEEAKRLPILKSLPHQFCAFHWHSDTFELPNGARKLFRSQECPEQGFLVGSNILGLQFHLEVTPDDIIAFIENSEEELAIGGPFVQSENVIKANLTNTKLLRHLLFSLMDDFMALKESPSLSDPSKGALQASTQVTPIFLEA